MSMPASVAKRVPLPWPLTALVSETRGLSVHVEYHLNILNGSCIIQLLDSWTNTSSFIKPVDRHHGAAPMRV